MSIQQMLMAAGGLDQYLIANSLRFNIEDTDYLNMTPSSDGNRKTFTHSWWLKKGRTNTNQRIFGLSGTNQFSMMFDGNDALYIYCTMSTSAFSRTSSAKFRDNSAWYHFVVSVDTTQNTDSDRVKFYVNGVDITADTTGSWPGQDTTFYWGDSSLVHYIGKYGGGAPYYFDGYLADVHMVDGLQLDASSFGETNATTGQWVPKDCSDDLTYGTNGFYLKFDNASDLGEDSSGQGNDWTANNLSTTAGAGNDQLTDTPTPFDDEGNGTGNYCTMNPLNNGSNVTLSEGNLQTYSTSASWTVTERSVGTIGMRTGKWYWECHISTDTYIYTGMISSEDPNVGYPGTLSAVGMLTSNCVYYGDGAQTRHGTGTGSDVTIMYAFDADDKKMWFGVDGTWLSVDYGNDVGDPSAGTHPSHTGFGAADSTYWPASSTYGSVTCQYNFGQRAFAHTPPTGFKALNTYNLDDTEILSGEYEGNADADGPVIWMNATPATLKIDTSDPPTTLVTFSPTTVDRLAGGFKIRNASTNNGSGTTYYWLATTDNAVESAFKYANAQTSE